MERPLRAIPSDLVPSRRASAALESGQGRAQLGYTVGLTLGLVLLVVVAVLAARAHPAQSARPGQGAEGLGPVRPEGQNH